ncbi:membrane-spanning 4-domains subfamily A member 4D-like isoform X2 [Pimephales promelas]|uniref:membrane-spanning 4-domains subfamily A member 4D-like isoform X2 n=1 Tax=Pimephales promelas TaxID=90988 RepID=UPI001955C773|nr:membrane-spanning 4-domains subfamily A member 4D-like isoform X2 [Pimephales promelas]
METSKILSSDKATVVIQVNPQVTQHIVSGDDGQESRGAHRSTALTGFSKAQPKALGTVQIMIGVVVFSLGIIQTIIYNYPSMSVVSGITYWGSLIFISAGSLSVAAQNKLHLCVVKASLIMNVISAITAATTIALMSIEMAIKISDLRRSYDDDYYYYNLKEYDLGIVGLMLVLSITQFIISICVSAFACKASYNSDSTVINVALNQGY